MSSLFSLLALHPIPFIFTKLILTVFFPFVLIYVPSNLWGGDNSGDCCPCFHFPLYAPHAACELHFAFCYTSHDSSSLSSIYDRALSAASRFFLVIVETLSSFLVPCFVSVGSSGARSSILGSFEGLLLSVDESDAWPDRLGFDVDDELELEFLLELDDDELLELDSSSPDSS